MNAQNNNKYCGEVGVGGGGLRYSKDVKRKGNSSTQLCDLSLWSPCLTLAVTVSNNRIAKIEGFFGGGG